MNVIRCFIETACMNESRYDLLPTSQISASTLHEVKILPSILSKGMP